MKNIKIKITKIARQTCDKYLNGECCLLATALKRTKRFHEVDAGYNTVELDGNFYCFSNEHARRIHNAYYEPVKAFKPFNVTLHARG